jgi:endonuclease/exonuclease/phosphatase family metal-dependent hydrolase
MSIGCARMLAIVAVVIGLVTGLAFAAAPGANSASGTPKLDVMTVNLEHKDRPNELRAAADYLRTELERVPDFILCQEVMFKRRGDLKDTAAVLANELGYESRGTKRKSDREGLAIISKYPFAFYDELHYKAQTTPLLLGFKRVSVMGEFLVPKVGRVRVVNVHFTNWGFERHVRKQQLKETMKWIADRQCQQPAVITFLGGDFNAKRHWNEMKKLDEKHGDGSIVFEDYNSDEPSQGLIGDPHQRIDYIFVSAGGGLEFKAEKIVFKEKLSDGNYEFRLSDHVAVLHSYVVKDAAALARLPQE